RVLRNFGLHHIRCEVDSLSKPDGKVGFHESGFTCDDGFGAGSLLSEFHIDLRSDRKKQVHARSEFDESPVLALYNTGAFGSVVDNPSGEGSGDLTVKALAKDAVFDHHGCAFVFGT